MRLPSWLRPFAMHLNPVRKRRAGLRPAFRPRLETLEERTLLSNYTAGTVTDLISDINAANQQGGTNTITLTAAASSPYILDNTTGALPDITANDNLTINTTDGANRTIERSSSASAFRLFTVDSGASLTLQELTLSGGLAQSTTGSAVNGGAILNGGTLAISNCTVVDNKTNILSGSPNYAGEGGGIYNTGTADVSNSTIADNTADDSGGGIFNAASATADVSNSTIADNTADESGGGIFNEGTCQLVNSTIADNGGGGYGEGGIVSEGGTCQLSNSIVAKNGPTGPDIGGGFTSQGHNLIGFEDVTAGGFTNGINGDIVGTAANPVDPLLAWLDDYGGPTQTLALLPGSPAIGAGDPSGTTGTDQRGVSRNQTAGNDIGAFESQGFTITATSGTTQTSLWHFVGGVTRPSAGR